MAAQTLTVLLIEDNPDYAAVVRHWLSQPGTDVEYVLNWTDSVADGRRRLARGDVSVILLDLNLPDSEGTGTFAAVHSQAPEVPLIILSADDEVSMALHLIQEGADNYLAKGLCNAESLTRAIRYAVVKHDSTVHRQLGEGSPDRAKIVAVIGGKGGVGTTTVACTLASELRRSTGEAVLLADLDMHAGLVAFLMAVKAEYNILYAVSNSTRLDRRMWERIVVQSEEGIDIACSPVLAGPSDALSGGLADQLSHVLAAIKPFYRWIVIDAGRLNSCTPKILEAADELVVVTTTSIPALYETKRNIEALRTGRMGDRIRLTINRMDSLEMFPRKELHSIFGVEVSAILPNSAAELQEAYLHKKMPAKDCAFTKEIAKLVQAIGGPAEIESRGSLLSLGELFRRKGKLQIQPAMK